MTMLPQHSDGSRSEVKRRPRRPVPVNTSYRRSWPAVGPYSPNKFKVWFSYGKFNYQTFQLPYLFETEGIGPDKQKVSA